MSEPQHRHTPYEKAQIAQAKHKLAARYSATPEDAYAKMVVYSQANTLRVCTLARRVLRGGSIIANIMGNRK